MRLLGVIGFVPLQKPEHEVQHVRTGFLDGGLGGGRDLAAYRVELLLIVQDWQGFGVVVVSGLVEIERCVPAEIIRMVFRDRASPLSTFAAGTGRNESFSLSRNLRKTESIGTSTTRREDALECLKLRSLLRLVRSRSRVRIRSRPVSVLPVKKSALMPGACCSGFSLPTPFCMAFHG